MPASEFAALPVAVVVELLPAVLLADQGADPVVADRAEVHPVVVLLPLADREVVHLALQAGVPVGELPVV